MLIHRSTMGILDQCWTGRYVQRGQDREPEMVECTFAGTGLPETDWWEVPRMSSLGRRLRAAYPWCDPVVDDTGQLVDIVVWPDWRRAGLPAPEGAEQTAPKKRRRRGKGLFADLLN